MKIKKRTLGVSVVLCVASLLVSLCLLCYSGSCLIASAEETNSSTTNTTAVTGTTEQPQNSTDPADEFNDKIRNWLGTIFGVSNTALSSILLMVFSKKKKEEITVTVNDDDTQASLTKVHNENESLRKLVTDMFQLQKGTFEILKTIFANNAGLDEKVKDTIKNIVLYENDVIKDFNDIVSSQTSEKAKTAIKNISNIILG